MIAVGVDTHKERHYAVALDHLGQMLAELVFIVDPVPATTSCSSGPRPRGRSERLCSGSKAPAAGAPGLCEHLLHAGHTVSRGRAPPPSRPPRREV